MAQKSEQDQAVAADTRGGQPLSGSQALPDMSHFAAEFYECCATLAGGLLTFPKVSPHAAKLLAMQREPL